jgi:hypothetical protein
VAERDGCEPQEPLGREGFEQQLLFFVLRCLPKTDVLQRAKYNALRAFALAERAALDAETVILVSEPFDQRLLGFASLPLPP